MDESKKFPCPVCGSLEMDEEKDSFSICHTCGYEDTILRQDFPDKYPINGYTLNQYRKAWNEGQTIDSNYPNPKGKKE